MILILTIINTIIKVFTWVILVDVLLSYFLPPNNPIKRELDKIVEPFLTLIRRYVPSTGQFDFSPLILLILLQIIEYVLNRIIG